MWGHVCLLVLIKSCSSLKNELCKTSSRTPAVSNLVFSAGRPYDSIKTFLGAAAATRHAGNGDYALVCGIAIMWTVACNLWDFHDTMCMCVCVCVCVCGGTQEMETLSLFLLLGQSSGPWHIRELPKRSNGGNVKSYLHTDPSQDTDALQIDHKTFTVFKCKCSRSVLCKHV